MIMIEIFATVLIMAILIIVVDFLLRIVGVIR
jgi:hypothetical protein